MKKIYAIAIMLLLAIGAHAQEGKRLYNKYSDSEGVSAIYISPAMFKIMGKIPELNVEVGEGEKFDMAPLINSFSGFYMLDICNKQLVDELGKEVNNMISKGRYEMLMEIKLSMLRFFQSANISHAHFHICLSTLAIKPLRSKIGMKAPGFMKPSSGWIHLTSASAPTSMPRESTIGCR